jgi:hypothetical protein
MDGDVVTGRHREIKENARDGFLHRGRFGLVRHSVIHAGLTVRLIPLRGRSGMRLLLGTS